MDDTDDRAESSSEEHSGDDRGPRRHDPPPEERRPGHEELHPWMGDGEMPRDVPEGAIPDEVPEDAVPDGDGDGEPPRILQVIGQVGVYVALVSLGLTAVGLVAIGAGIQPLGNIATTLALAGVTAAMFMGMLFQAYVSDFAVGSSQQ